MARADSGYVSSHGSISSQKSSQAIRDSYDTIEVEHKGKRMHNANQNVINDHLQDSFLQHDDKSNYGNAYFHSSPTDITYTKDQFATSPKYYTSNQYSPSLQQSKPITFLPSSPNSPHAHHHPDRLPRLNPSQTENRGRSLSDSRLPGTNGVVGKEQLARSYNESTIDQIMPRNQVVAAGNPSTKFSSTKSEGDRSRSNSLHDNVWNQESSFGNTFATMSNTTTVAVDAASIAIPRNKVQGRGTATSIAQAVLILYSTTVDSDDESESDEGIYVGIVDDDEIDNNNGSFSERNEPSEANVDKEFDTRDGGYASQQPQSPSSQYKPTSMNQQVYQNQGRPHLDRPLPQSPSQDYQPLTHPNLDRPLPPRKGSLQRQNNLNLDRPLPQNPRQEYQPQNLDRSLPQYPRQGSPQPQNNLNLDRPLPQNPRQEYQPQNLDRSLPQYPRQGSPQTQTRLDLDRPLPQNPRYDYQPQVHPNLDRQLPQYPRQDSPKPQYPRQDSPKPQYPRQDSPKPQYPRQDSPKPQVSPNMDRPLPKSPRQERQLPKHPNLDRSQSRSHLDRPLPQDPRQDFQPQNRPILDRSQSRSHLDRPLPQDPRQDFQPQNRPNLDRPLPQNPRQNVQQQNRPNLDRPLPQGPRQADRDLPQLPNGMELQQSVQVAPAGQNEKKNSDPAARIKKRELAVKEIITSERTYVEGLRKCVSFFLNPLRENCQKATAKNGLLPTKRAASAEDINLIFGNIEQLLTLHEQLLKSLEERYQQWNPNGFISDIFIRTAPYLKMYTTYLKNFPQAVGTIERLKKEAQAFKKLVAHCVERPELGGLPMNSFLTLPIQRIPRYKMLLEAVLKYTDEFHPDYENLQKCVQQISVIADEVNEKIRDAENQQKIVEIQGLPDDIVKPARRFIHKGDLYKVVMSQHYTTPSKGSDARTYFLFNDLLLFCLNNNGKHTYETRIDLASASIRDIEDGLYTHPYCFQIVTNRGDYVVRATTYEEKRDCIERFDDTIWKLQNGARATYGADGKRLIPLKLPAIPPPSS